MANTTGRKVQVPVMGGLRKVIRVGGGGDTGTTLSGFANQTLTIGQLRALLGLTAGNSAAVTPGGGGGGSSAQIVLGNGLAGGGPVVGSVPITLIQPIPAFIFDDGASDDAPPPVPGQRGVNGATGAPGPAGPGIYLSDVPDEIEPLMIPGSRGPTGGPGSNGVQGQNGVAIWFTDSELPDDPMMIPGSRGPAGATGAAGTGGGGSTVWMAQDDPEETAMVGYAVQRFPVGSGSGGNITPDTHPSSPTAWDDEFEGSSISSAWTVYSAATSPLTYALGAGSVCVTGGSNPVLLAQAVPSGTWEFTCKTAAPISGAGYASWGLGVMNSTTGAIGEIALYTGDGNVYWQRGTVTLPAVTYSFGANDASNYSTFIGPKSGWVYLKIVYDGTNIICSVSQTGIPGSFAQLFSQNAASVFGTLTHVILANATISSGPPPGAACDWFRRTA